MSCVKDLNCNLNNNSSDTCPLASPWIRYYYLAGGLQLARAKRQLAASQLNIFHVYDYDYYILWLRSGLKLFRKRNNLPQFLPFSLGKVSVFSFWIFSH